jgi:hypothetical protein
MTGLNVHVQGHARTCLDMDREKLIIYEHNNNL